MEKKEFRLSFVEIVHYIPTTTQKDFEKRGWMNSLEEVLRDLWTRSMLSDVLGTYKKKEGSQV